MAKGPVWQARFGKVSFGKVSFGKVRSGKVWQAWRNAITKGGEEMEATIFTAKHCWKRNMSVKADVAAAELERIREENPEGILDPEEVVFASEDEGAVLHKLFTWDDVKAAHGYRVEQAKYIIRNLVTVEDTEDEPVMTRAIVSTGNRMYQPITTVLSDADLRSRLLDAAKREMLTFKMKYRHLHELAAVFEAMDTVQ